MGLAQCRAIVGAVSQDGRDKPHAKTNGFEQSVIFDAIGNLPYGGELQNGDFRQIQQRATDAYRQDFSRHTSGEQAVRIRNVFDSIPSQLARKNGKFLYGALKTGAKARKYESAIMWLRGCGGFLRETLANPKRHFTFAKK